MAEQPFKVRNSHLQLDADGGSNGDRAEVWGFGGPNMVIHEDHFLFLPSTEADGPWIFNAGADAQAIDPALDATQSSGVIQCVTGNADADPANDSSYMVLNKPIQLDSLPGDVVIEAKLRITSAITTVSVWCGLTDTTAADEEPVTNSSDTLTTVASDAALFHYDTDATTDEWWMVGVDSNTDDTGNAALGVAPVADTWQILRMQVNNDGSEILFSVDGVQYGALSAAGVSPDVALYFTIGANATTTTSRTVDVDWVRIVALGA